MRKLEQAIDNLLDQYLEGRLTEQEIKLLHEHLEHTHDEHLTNELLDKIHLPSDLLPTQATTPPKSDYEFLLHLPANDPPEPGFRSLIKQYLPLLAGLVFVSLLLPIGYLFSHRQQLTVFEHYFKPYPIVQRTLPDPGLQEKWNSAAYRYIGHDYYRAIGEFNLLLNRQIADNYLDQFYIGISYLANNEPRQALEYLEQAAAVPSNIKQPAQWYLALAYLLNENHDLAKHILTDIVNGDNTFKKAEAQKLLEAL